MKIFQPATHSPTKVNQSRAQTTPPGPSEWQTMECMFAFMTAGASKSLRILFSISLHRIVLDETMTVSRLDLNSINSTENIHEFIFEFRFSPTRMFFGKALVCVSFQMTI